MLFGLPALPSIAECIAQGDGHLTDVRHHRTIGIELNVILTTDAAVGDRSSSQCDEGCLYRVKSCPDIVDQLTTTTKAECDPSPQSSQLVAAQLKEKRVRLRARDSARDQRPLADQQRYSCGALEQAVVRLSSDDGDDEITSVQQLSSPYGSNQSLSNCNSFSVIKVS